MLLYRLKLSKRCDHRTPCSLTLSHTSADGLQTVWIVFPSHDFADARVCVIGAPVDLSRRCGTGTRTLSAYYHDEPRQVDIPIQTIEHLSEDDKNIAVCRNVQEYELRTLLELAKKNPPSIERPGGTRPSQPIWDIKAHRPRPPRGSNSFSAS